MTAPRRATSSDVEALVCLRAVLAVGAVGLVGVVWSDCDQVRQDGVEPDGVGQDRWRSAAGWWFAERLDGDADFAAFVIERDGRVVSGAAGRCDRGVPSAENPTGIHGYVFNVATETSWRRQGLATACVDSLIDWFASSTRAGVLVLEASGPALPLFRGLGFSAGVEQALRLVPRRR